MTGQVRIEEETRKEAKPDAKKSNKKPPHHGKTHGANWSRGTNDCCCPFKDNRNRTWSCKADKAKKKSQKKLATVIAKPVKDQLKKELASADEKRKSDDKD